MLRKYPIFVSGIGTKAVTPAASDFSPLAEMFMKRALARETRQPKAAKDPYGDSKLEATYGEGLARQERINDAKSTINYYRGIYGPDMEHVVNNIPEVRQAYGKLDVEYSEGMLNAYKQNKGIVEDYRKRIGTDKAGDEFALQFIHKFGIGNGDAPTYGTIGDLMERSPDMTESWQWYNTNHSTEGVDTAIGKIMDQFKSLGETQRKSEAYKVGSVAASTLKGIYEIPGISESEKEHKGYDNTSNLAQVTQRKGLVSLDENMLHGLEQGYMSWLKQGGYLDHVEGATLEMTDEDGKKQTYTPKGDNYSASGKGQQYDSTGSMALSFPPSVALFDKNGRPNENYYKGFEDFVAEKINFAAAGFVTDKRVTLHQSTASSFRPLEGDALAEALRKQRLEAMMQSGLYSMPMDDQVVTDGVRDLDMLTGNGKPQSQMSETEKDYFQKMLTILGQGTEYGFINNVPNINSSADLQQYLANAPKSELDYIDLELGVAGLPPVASAYRQRELGVEGQFGKSELTESPTPALNGELLFSTRQRYRMGNDEWLMDMEKLGGMPLKVAGLDRDPRDLNAKFGGHYELGEGFVLNSQSAPTDAAGNFKYEQPGGELDYLEDIQKFQMLSQTAADPEKYQQQFGNWGPMKSKLSTALIANQGTYWVPKENFQSFIDETLVMAPKEWSHNPKQLQAISDDEAKEYARKNNLGLKFEEYMGKETSSKKPVYVTADGRRLIGSDAINVIKGYMLDDQINGNGVPGTATHTAQRKTMKGDETVTIKTYTTKTVGGQKLPASGPTIKLKADRHLPEAYGKLSYKVDENGNEFIGVESRLNNNDVLETDPDVLKVLYAREREKAAAQANGAAGGQKSKVIIKK